ncbi:MAG: hypothetical protein KIT80_12315 [Chitinophagaceae bacterium]|nr:hypothetical protein [Chitinophagaceae bacterium]MCW5927687.1 hypothetical protein [Chitinophagaceae bacterium]
MKKLLVILIGLFTAYPCLAQQPVEWSFYSRKLADNSYEIHLQATIDKGWYIYSQSSSKKSAPTEIKILPDNNLKLKGSIKEEGTLIKKRELGENTNAHLFENQVDFIQQVTTGNGQPKIIKGTISYTPSNGMERLPVQTVNFSIILGRETE